MSGEILNSDQTSSSETFEGVPRPGIRMAGSLAEAFGFEIDDKARELYTKNMVAINESTRKADEIARTTIIST